MPYRTSPAIAKLTRPTAAGTVRRDRLFRLLDECIDHAGCWITGAPGIGKTRLVASYLEARKLRTIWYQVDGGDADPATFFYYLRQVATRLTPRRKVTLALLTPEYLPDLQGFARRFFQALFDILPKPFVLVFDNVHVLQNQPGTLAMLAIAFDQLPRDITLIVIGRADPPAEFSRLIAARALTVFDEQMLQLTQAEARQIAKSRGETDEKQIDQLAHTVGGWAAGMELILEHRRRAGRDAPPATWASRQALFDYFASESYGELRAEVRELLLRTAVLPYVTSRMAEALSGKSDADKWLEYLCRHHHFTTRRSGTEATYEYHALFREFLLVRGRDELTPIQYRGLALDAARLLENQGANEEALLLYQAAGDQIASTGLIRTAAPQLLSQGRGETLRNWISTLPSNAVSADPWLQYWYGISLVQVNQAEARHALAQAFAAFAGHGERSGQLLSVAGIVECHYFEWADFRPLDKWIPEFENLLSHDSAFGSTELELRAYSSFLIALMYRQPRHSLLPVCAKRVAELVATDVDVNQKVSAATFLLDYYSSIGLYELAHQVVAEIEPILNSSSLTAFNRVRWLSEYAYLLNHQGSFVEQAKTLNRAQEIAQAQGLASSEVNILFLKAADALAAENLKVAREFLARLEQVLEPARRVDSANYYYLRCSVALLQKDAELALREARHAVELANGTGITVAQAFYLCLFACLLVENNDFEMADRALNDALAIIAGMHYPLLEYHIAAVRALSALRQGDSERCHSLLRGVLAAGRRERYLLLFRALPQPAARLCAEALQAGIEVDYVQDIIKRRGLLPPSRECESWPWTVRVYTLGAFRVVLDEVPSRAGGKAQRKPLDLLKCLVALGGGEIGPAAVISLLWPDSEGDVAQTAFDVTLHRLRKLLRHDKAILLDNGRLTLNPTLVWTDVGAFERLLRRGEAWLQRGDEQSPRALDQIIGALFDLYQGHFLRMEGDQSWMLEMREKLRSRFLRLLVAIGRYWETRGQWERATELYQRGTEVDNLAEELYRRLMAAYQKSGQPAGAIEAYRRCRQMLSVALGVKPSPETEALYESVKRG